MVIFAPTSDLLFILNAQDQLNEVAVRGLSCFNRCDRDPIYILIAAIVKLIGCDRDLRSDEGGCDRELRSGPAIRARNRDLRSEYH